MPSDGRSAAPKHRRTRAEIHQASSARCSGWFRKSHEETTPFIHVPVAPSVRLLITKITGVLQPARQRGDFSTMNTPPGGLCHPEDTRAVANIVAGTRVVTSPETRGKTDWGSLRFRPGYGLMVNTTRRTRCVATGETHSVRGNLDIAFKHETISGIMVIDPNTRPAG
jgi:hypothetical protein